MFHFEYYAPTKVIFGKEAEKQVGKLIQECQGKRVLLHYGGTSAEKSGLLGKIKGFLEQEGIAYEQLGGVVPNPRLSKVYEGIALCKKEKLDFILAVGGGSVIDSAKAIGYGMCYDGDVWDLFCGKAQAAGCMPIGVVLTIAAAGSEMSNSCVITNEEGWLKRGYKSEYCRCKFAVLNPELTYTLPNYQTQCGCVDIIMHTMERYFVRGGTMELTDGICETLMRTVIKNAIILKHEPADYDARAEVMWASSLSHNNLTGCGADIGGDWACHQLEHELGGLFDIAHGAGLAAVWGSWARYVYREDATRFARYAVQVMGIQQNGTQEEIALAGIEATEAFFKSIDMPINIHEMNIVLTDEQLDQLAYKCSFMGTRTIGKFKQLNQQDMKAIYEMAK